VKYMICCLNPGCKLENPPCPDTVQYCTSCGTKLVLLSDRYRPVRRIGEGGFGVTYLAQDRERFNKDCVIKQLTVHNSKAKELFEQEAKQLEHLGSQCSQIPRLLAYPSDKQYLYLVQEFIAGQNLDEYLADKGVQNEEQIKDFLNSLLPVLDLIHKNRIIHRDIKLDNIMRRDNGTLVLIDFGVAKQFIDNNTPVPGTIAGTPGYAPSEQMNKAIAYPSSDLYSLGAACFHLLTGKHPYKAYEVDDFSWTSKWRQYLPQPISPGLGKIIDKMLQEKYQNRYQSAGEIIKALQDLKPQNPDPQNPSVHLTHKTAWLNFYTALIGGAFVLVSGVFTVINQQPKNPSTTISPSNNTETAETYYQRGQELDDKDSKGAIEAFTKAIELKSGYTLAYIYRGLARYDLDDNKGAIEDFSQAINLKPNIYISYAYRGLSKSSLRKKGAIDDFKQVLNINPGDAMDWMSRLSLGIAKLEIGDIKGSVEDFTKAIKLKPDLWRAYNFRGHAKHNLGDNKSALENYNQAIKLKSDNLEAYINRGVTKLNMGDKKGAIEDYNQTIKLKPDFAEAYNFRASTRYSLDDKKGAIEDYAQAAKLFQKQGKNKDSQAALEEVKKLSK
jgi:serine/threonine protein kinase